MVHKPGQVSDQDRESSQFPEFRVCECCLVSIDFGCCKGDVEHDRTSLAAVVFFHLLEQENTIDLVEEDSKKHLEVQTMGPDKEWAAALGKELSLCRAQ